MSNGEAREHRTRIFSEGDYLAGTLTWGWECECGTEETGLGSATGAGHYADEHEQSAP